MPESNQTNERSAEEEIKELERLLAEKKDALGSGSIEKEPKEIFVPLVSGRAIFSGCLRPVCHFLNFTFFGNNMLVIYVLVLLYGHLFQPGRPLLYKPTP